MSVTVTWGVVLLVIAALLVGFGAGSFYILRQWKREARVQTTYYKKAIKDYWEATGQLRREDV